MRQLILIIALSAALAAGEHPYLVWTAADIATMKQRIAADPAYKARAEAPLANAGWRGQGVVFHNLFRAAVLDDATARDAELANLRSFIGTHPSRFAGEPKDGGIGYGGRHFDNHENALRYDLLYDRLTAAERTGVEDTFRAYIQHQLGDTKEYTRTSWLPNMQWPRPLSAHFMALALGDLAAFEKLGRIKPGWFWYWDEYVSDGRFYNEEFGKQYSMNGQILLVCRALRNLGKDEWGFSYQGKGCRPGETSVRNYFASYFDIMLPGIDLGTPRMLFGYFTSGDQRHGAPHRAFPTAVLSGLLPGQAVGSSFVNDGQRLWSSNRMNGQSHLVRTQNPNIGVSKMRFPLWMELCHQAWPDDARFAWALGQLAAPDAPYQPSPYFLAAPVTAPAAAPPAPSTYGPERGIAVLRSEEGPAHWTSPAPAVALRFANNYVHEVNDSLSIANFHAFNRMLIHNGQTCNDYASNDPDFSQGTLGHTAVLADHGHAGKDNAATSRFASHREGPRFVAVRAKVYEGVDQTRALLLTGEYLLDVSRLVAGSERTFTWVGHPLGRAQGLDGFAPFPDMGAHLCPKPATDRNRRQGAFFADAQRRELGGATWGVTVLQDAGPGWEQEPVGRAWFERGIGVRLSLAGVPGSVAMVAARPQFYEKSQKKIDGKYQDAVDQESAAYGGTTVAIERTASATTFVALWEPFQGGKPAGLAIEVLADEPSGVLVRVRGGKVDDLIAIRLGDAAEKPAAIGGLGVADHAWLRRGGAGAIAGGWQDAAAARAR